MSIVTILLYTGPLVISITIILIALGPPLQYFWQHIANRMHDASTAYSGYWLGRLYDRESRRQSGQARKSFDRWFAARFSGASDAGINDGDLVNARELTPIIRQLLEEEVPTTIRRCNQVHRRIALLVRANHMREIAGEPECVSLRQWTALLLEKTATILEQYPLPLRLDTEELLDATVVVRNAVLPACRNCAYIRSRVSEAGEFCPASQLIGLDQKKC